MLPVVEPKALALPSLRVPAEMVVAPVLQAKEMLVELEQAALLLAAAVVVQVALVVLQIITTSSVELVALVLLRVLPVQLFITALVAAVDRAHGVVQVD